MIHGHVESGRHIRSMDRRLVEWVNLKQMIEQEAVKARTGGEVVLICTGILVCSTQIMVPL